GTIGDRSFGDDPEVVAAHVRAAIRGLQDEGMLACAKHFPGHGASDQDSHRELPVVSLSRDELDQRDLLPFKAAIEQRVAAIMTAHVVYPIASQDQWPATLSPFWLKQVLRDELAFDGLIITDAIEMKGLIGQWTPEECGFQALRAGADILLYYKEAYQFLAFYELRLALERGHIDPHPVEQ